MEIKVEKLDDGQLLVNAEYQEVLSHNGIDTAKKLWDISSDPIKNVLKERGTELALLEPLTGSKGLKVYIKRYQPVPLLDRIEAAIAFKPGNFDAFHEWNAQLAFCRLGLPSVMPMAVGRVGKQTCNLTLGINDYTRASELFEKFGPGDGERRRKLIDKIAGLVGKMHSSGYAHQDLYLVHMFVKAEENDQVYLIDLQRTIFPEKFSQRWRVKDLGELLFSALPLVSRTDLLRFWKKYTSSGNDHLVADRDFLRLVWGKGDAIRRRQERKRKK